MPAVNWWEPRNGRYIIDVWTVRRNSNPKRKQSPLPQPMPSQKESVHFQSPFFGWCAGDVCIFKGIIVTTLLPVRFCRGRTPADTPPAPHPIHMVPDGPSKHGRGQPERTESRYKAWFYHVWRPEILIIIQEYFRKRPEILIIIQEYFRKNMKTSD